MTWRLCLVSAMVVLVASSGCAAPERSAAQESDASGKYGKSIFEQDITELVNGALQDLLSELPTIISLNEPIVLPIESEPIAHLLLHMENCQVNGLKGFVAHDCWYDKFTISNNSITISATSPLITLTTNPYFLNGTLVNIDLEGEGPGTISVNNMKINIFATGQVHLLDVPFWIEFDTAALNLEMNYWTVNLEGILPGTDLGTVFNEFMSMSGPEIFEMIENSINGTGVLLKLLNSLFPKPSPEA